MEPIVLLKAINVSIFQQTIRKWATRNNLEITSHLFPEFYNMLIAKDLANRCVCTLFPNIKHSPLHFPV